MQFGILLVFYIINKLIECYMVAWGIGKFSPSFENTVQHSGENVVFLHVHLISSMYDIPYMHIILTNSFVYSCTCYYAPTSVYSVVSSCC